MIVTEIMAELSAELGDKEKSNFYYLEALELRPYDVELLLDYSGYLLRSEGDVETALLYAERAYLLQPNFVRSSILLYQIHLSLKSSSQEKYRLNLENFIKTTDRLNSASPFRNNRRIRSKPANTLGKMREKKREEYERIIRKILQKENIELK